MSIKMVKTLVNRNRYNYLKDVDNKVTSAIIMYDNYIMEQYERHEDLVNNIITELSAKNNILWTGTREHIYHRNNNGYEDKFLIITEIHYELKI